MLHAATTILGDTVSESTEPVPFSTTAGVDYRLPAHSINFCIHHRMTTLPFREALNKGIVSGTLVDTKIVLFTRKDSSGRVSGPKALYASSHVLKSVPYFNDLLFGTFSEAELTNFDDDVGGHEFDAEGYGYDSDSDLEDEDRVPILARNESSAGISSQPHPQGGEDHRELDNKGKIVRIHDVAFVTFQAFIFYLYTGQIEFAPLGSRIPSTVEVPAPHKRKIPRPSPKSIYRLADKVCASSSTQSSLVTLIMLLLWA